jgi:formate/nitrite transporter
LEAIHAHLTIEHIGPEFRFVIAGCPLLNTSKQTGLAEIELAQFGFNVMCQSLIQVVDPHLLLNVPPGDETDQVFTLIQPTHPPLERQSLPAPASQGAPRRKEESIDAFPPPAMAVRAIESGIQKSALDTLSTFMLAILAGAFIAMGAIFATTVAAGATGVPYGVVRLLTGLAFTLGLIMVVVAGAELFTGNNMLIMAFLSGKVTVGKLLRNWLLVYIGNFVGALLTAYLMFLSRQYTFGNGVTGLTMLNIGEAKTNLGFLQAVVLGMGCNALVCMAVWMCYSARSTIDKILAVVAPITAFVAVGFEHSVANMYFIPVALFVKYLGSPLYYNQIQKTPADFPNLTLSNFLLANLLPVTIGNIIGGTIMVGVMYWLIYLRKSTHLVPRPVA